MYNDIQNFTSIILSCLYKFSGDINLAFLPNNMQATKILEIYVYLHNYSQNQTDDSKNK